MLYYVFGMDELKDIYQLIVEHQNNNLVDLKVFYLDDL
jgi:hypothetical protein